MTLIETLAHLNEMRQQTLNKEMLELINKYMGIENHDEI